MVLSQHVCAQMFDLVAESMLTVRARSSVTLVCTCSRLTATLLDSTCGVTEGKEPVGSSQSASEASRDKGKQQPSSKSAFSDRAERAFSDKLQDSASADLGRKASAGYTGLNPTGTRSASRLFSSDPPPQPKASAPLTKRDMVANSILQIQMDNELDTFTADIDCMWDSSDDDNDEEQPVAKGKKESPAKGGKQERQKQDRKAEPERQEQKQDPARKKKQKGEYDEKEADDDEEVDHANMEGNCAARRPG